MARIRSIKPEFWSSDQIVECSRDARLLFIGIWNFADDAGVIPANPRGLKMKVFPGELDIDGDSISGMLDELSSNDLIVRYIVDGKEYLKVSGWSNHQRIDKPTRKYPQPIEDNSTNTPGGIDEPSPPDRSGGDVDVDTSSNEEESPAEPATPAADACPAQDIVTIYHEQLPELPRVARLTEKRRKWLKARWREEPEHQQLDFWRKFFAYIRGSDFLMGNNPRGWCADFEWIVNVTNFYKIIEGRYDNDAQRS